MNELTVYRRSAVLSADGTTVSYREAGHGPAVILLHGGMMASRNFVRLGAALSGKFTVIIPDRRGRGQSGAFGERYGIAKETADIDALVKKTGASSIFGLSSGAIIALFAALVVPSLRKIAAYEPPFSINGSNTADWAPRFDREVKRGDLAAAMVTVMKGTGDFRPIRFVPHVLLTPLVNLGIRANKRGVPAGEVTIEELIPTMHYDAELVKETSASIGKLDSLAADVLLLGGSRSAPFLKAALDGLATHLPGAERIELAGVGHVAADDNGRPDLVASALARFFA